MESNAVAAFIMKLDQVVNDPDTGMQSTHDDNKVLIPEMYIR